MERATFQAILQQCKPFSKLLHFHVLGEPLLHPEIGLFLDDCLENGFQVHIVTNGVLLPDAGHQLLKKPALRSVSISLQSVCSYTDRIDDYLSAIHHFVNRSQSIGGPVVILRLWNYMGLSDENRNDVLFTKIKKEFHLDDDIVEKIKDKRGVNLSDSLCINIAERFDWPGSTVEYSGDTGYCLGCIDQVAILVDGTVVPCCLDSQGQMNLGNIRCNSLKEILSSERATAIRDGFRHGVIVESLCKKCSYRLRFKKKIAD
jgi:radical SAM protein with 4Fe4S-binding SPASM domain